MEYKGFPITIRPSKKDDFVKIYAIAEKDTKYLALNKGQKRAILRRHCGSKQNHVIVAEANGELIGMAHKTDKKNKKCTIEEVVVDSQARGCKIASLLLLWYITEMDITGFEAKTFASNSAVHQLNFKFGMQVVKKSPKGEMWDWDSCITPIKKYHITDCHIHMCPKELLQKIKQNLKPGAATTFITDNSSNEVIKAMDLARIESAVVFPFPFKELDFDNANQYILEMAQKYPNRFAPVGLIDSNVKKWVKAGMVGFKEHSYYMDTTRNTYLKEYKILADEGLPLLIHPHMNNKADRILFTLKHISDLKIVLCHSGRKKLFTGENVIDIARELAEHENVFFDTSTVWDANVIRQLIGIVGINRVLFGSDHPFTLIDRNQDKVIQREMAFIRAIGLPDKDLGIILGETTRQLFKMKPIIEQKEKKSRTKKK